MKILGVITARGGSKGIPGKNIKKLAGRPLIAYTIRAAKDSGVFDRVIVSTDDDAIAAVAAEEGCAAPFMRPKELARDDTPHIAVMQHAVRWLKEQEQYEPDAAMILQPTAPLRKALHIQEAVALFQKTGADSLVSVSAVPGHHNPHWQFTVDEASRMKIFTGEPFSKIIRRRQDLPQTYARNGAIYLFKTGLLFDAADPSFYGADVAGYVMDAQYSVNLDTMDDWEKAEQMITASANN